MKVKVTLNGTGQNRWKELYNLRCNPFPQIPKAEAGLANRILADLDGDPIVGEADLRARLRGCTPEFIDGCVERFRPGQRVTFVVEFPALTADAPARRTQQALVYDAQLAVGRGRIFGSHEEVQTFLDELTAESWWPEHVIRVEVQRLDRNNKHSGLANWDEFNGAGVIGLRSDALDMRTVAHELAHVFANRYRQSGHDPAFCRTFIETTYRLMGSDAFTKLRASFDRHGVEYG